MPRDPRLYITVHHEMPEHPKVVGLSDAAFRTLVKLWCYAHRLETDGHLKAAVVNGYPRKVIAELSVGDEPLLERNGDDWIVHDYLEHQQSKTEINELREKRRRSGSAGGKAKAKHIADALALAKQNSSEHVADLDLDIDLDKEQEQVATRERDALADPPPSAPRSINDRGTRLSEDWRPSPEDITYRQQKGIPDQWASNEVEAFREFWLAKPGAAGRKTNWSLTWYTWLRRSMERAPQPVRDEQARILRSMTAASMAQ